MRISIFPNSYRNEDSGPPLDCVLRCLGTFMGDGVLQQNGPALLFTVLVLHINVTLRDMKTSATDISAMTAN
jgi:hypothetical protein